jgi:tRNA (cmo5U34)-methyltransferase
LADLRDVAMSSASLVILNFTLQFVPSDDRHPLLQSCFDAMLPGAALLLSEKVCFEEPGQQKLLTDLHLDFKRACGYSELEIAQKRTSLENTLIPESMATHTGRLRDIGFQTVTPWFQCFNFASFLAVKGPSEVT